jgi:hypothetical protein
MWLSSRYHWFRRSALIDKPDVLAPWLEEVWLLVV